MKFLLISTLVVTACVGQFSIVQAQTSEVSDFSVRQKALLTIFELTKIQLGDIEEKLQHVPHGTESELIEVKKAFLSSIETLSGSLEGERKRAVAAKTSEEIKKIAIDFKVWRETDYNPAISRMLDLHVLFRSVNLLSISDDRLKRVTVDVQKLEDRFGSQASPLRTDLAIASGAIRTAHSQYEDARETFLDQNQLSPDGSLVVRSPSTVLDTEGVVLVEVDVKELVESMVESLKSAYRTFFSMSELAKKIIAHPGQ